MPDKHKYGKAGMTLGAAIGGFFVPVAGNIVGAAVGGVVGMGVDGYKQEKREKKEQEERERVEREKRERNEQEERKWREQVEREREDQEERERKKQEERKRREQEERERKEREKQIALPSAPPQAPTQSFPYTGQPTVQVVSIYFKLTLYHNTLEGNNFEASFKLAAQPCNESWPQ